MLKIGIVGFGWWGKHIATRLANSPHYDVRAIAEPNHALHDAIHALGTNAVDALETLLQDDSISAIILTSPNHLHDSQIMACVEAGKHVFCEKPLSLTASGARASVRACAQAGLVLGIGHERRFEPAIAAMKAHLDAGDLGTIMHTELAFSHNKLSGLGAESWRTQKQFAPAAGMTQTGIHLTDMLVWFFGPVAQVQALAVDRALGWETGELLSVQLQFAAGMTATMQAILNTPHFLRTHVFGSDEWIEIRNATHPDTPGGDVTMTRYRELGDQTVTTFDWVDSVMANLEAFRLAVAGQAPYPFTDFEKTHNIEVMEAIIQSAESRETVRL